MKLSADKRSMRNPGASFVEVVEPAVVGALRRTS